MAQNLIWAPYARWTEQHFIVLRLTWLCNYGFYRALLAMRNASLQSCLVLLCVGTIGQSAAALDQECVSTLQSRMPKVGVKSTVCSPWRAIWVCAKRQSHERLVCFTGCANVCGCYER